MKEDFTEIKIKLCKECVHYKKPSCPFGNQAKPNWSLSTDYGINCWQNEEDKILCDMMCGGVEND